MSLLNVWYNPCLTETQAAVGESIGEVISDNNNPRSPSVVDGA